MHYRYLGLFALLLAMVGAWVDSRADDGPYAGLLAGVAWCQFATPTPLCDEGNPMTHTGIYAGYRVGDLAVEGTLGHMSRPEHGDLYPEYDSTGLITNQTGWMHYVDITIKWEFF